jgi:hypothetical protein
VTSVVPAPVDVADKSLGEAALVWAKAGWDVFPIVPRGKTPYATGEFCHRTDAHSCGFHCATNDQTTIGLWWSLHPDSNIGLASSDAFIVDEDRIGALLEAGVKLPRSPYQATGRAGGGRHFFLRAPSSWAGLEGETVKVTPKVPAVEVKGFGKGYVVAAPSVHATGARYELKHGGYLPEAPTAVIKKLVDVERAGVNPGGAFITVGGEGFQLPERVAEGNRYETIRSYVAHLYNRGFSIDEMWASVRVNLAPLFAPRLSERELRDRFERATGDMEKRLGERRTTAAAPVAIPTALDDAPLTEFDSRPVQWVWPSWLPRGVVTVMDGNPGVSKSTLVADLVARLTTGREWPDGQPAGDPVRALWVTTEDDPGRVLRPRIEAAGGDPSMVLFVRSEVVFPAARTAFLELLVKRAGEPLGLGLAVLDPLFSHIEASVRTIADAEMRRGVMNPLNEAAEAADVALLVVRHFSKDVTASAVNRGAGSLGGIVGAARALWTVAADPDDETGETKAVGVSKLNYAKSPPALRYQVVDRVPPGWITGSVSGIEWLGAASVSMAEILRESPSSHDAQPVLKAFLADGAKSSEAVHAHMRSKGYGRDATRSAASRLGVRKGKAGFQGTSLWALPQSDGQSDVQSDGADGLDGLDDGSQSDVQSDANESGPVSLDALRRTRGRSRAGRDHHADSLDGLGESGDESSSPSSLTPSGALPAGARVETGPGEWAGEPCRDYENHRNSHRRTEQGWICDICSGEGAA